MAKDLIVNADDFGLSPGVSQGIIQAHHEGILTSTTMMVNFPWAPACAAMLQEAPGLAVGIHLNATTGRPVLPAAEVPSLVTPEGAMSKRFWHLRFGIKWEELVREWEAQVARGMELIGRRPTHLDTHGFTQGYAGFAKAMVTVARKFGIQAVRILRPGPQMPRPATFRGWSPLDLLYQRYLRASCQLTEASGLKRPDQTAVGDWDVERLLARLERLEPGVTELVCHPGRVDETVRQISSLQERREVELAALTDPRVRRAMAQHGIRLISFADL